MITRIHWPESVGFLISGSAVLWAVHLVDFTQLKLSFGNLDLAWLPILAAVYLLIFPIRGLRWKLVLKPIEPVKLTTTTSIILIARMANNLLPARIGEIIRAGILARKSGINKSTSLTSVIVERSFDGIALLIIFIITSSLGLFDEEQQSRIEDVNHVAMFLLGGMIIFVFMARSYPETLLSLAKRYTRWLPWQLNEVVLGFLARAFEITAISYRLNLRLAIFLLLSLAAWLVEGIMFMLALAAFGLPMDPVVACFTLALVNMGIAVPSTLGDVGVFHACAIFAFTAFHFSIEQAFSYAIVVHAMEFIPATVVGLIVLSYNKISLATLRSAEEMR